MNTLFLLVGIIFILALASKLAFSNAELTLLGSYLALWLYFDCRTLTLICLSIFVLSPFLVRMQNQNTKLIVFLQALLLPIASHFWVF
ncbi:hypothetical protein [Vibrio maritimus]|uniref:hypothetical protein n=1 Tax=Vibrio maritimus TaxID=990268 RepID=UPI0037364A23